MIGIPEVSQNAGAATKANLKASGGRVFAIRVTNANVAARFFGIHNKATAPVATDVPVFWVVLPAGTAAAPSVTTIGSDFFGEAGLPLGTGVGWSLGTTSTAFTDAATAADHLITVAFG